jgi:hypothetical protein
MGLQTIAEIDDGLRITAKVMGAQGDLVSASRNMAVLVSINFRAKELELKGMNMRTDEGEAIHFTATDYADRYQGDVAKNAEPSCVSGLPASPSRRWSTPFTHQDRAAVESLLRTPSASDTARQYSWGRPLPSW